MGFDVTSVKSERAAEEGVPIVGSLEHLQQKGPYDIVISSSVIEHIRDPNENVTALRSILRPRGLLFIKGIIGCAKDSMSWAKINKSYRSSGSVPKDINPWEHLNYFSLSTLSQLLEERGFFELNAKKGLWTRR